MSMRSARLSSNCIVFALIFIVSASSLSFFSGNASAINPADVREVKIDCNDYIRGTAPIDVYSNSSVKSYNLTIDGNLLSSDTNPVQYASHQWNQTYHQVRSGTFSGTTAQNVMDTNNTDYVRISSRTTGGTRTAAIASWFHNSSAPDFSSVQNMTVHFSVMIEGAGTGTNLYYERWNGATWTTVVTIAAPQRGVILNRQIFYTGGNLTTALSQYDPRTQNLGFSARSTITGTNHFLRIYYLAIQYNTNEPIVVDGNFRKIDTYNLDTTLYPDGVYNLTATVVDMTDNVFTDTKNVTIDNTAPQVIGMVATPMSKINTVPVDIDATLNETNIGTTYGTYVNQLGHSIYTADYPGTNLNFSEYFSNGTYTFDYVSIDLAGNAGMDSVTFTVSYYTAVQYIDNPNIVVFVQFKADLGTYSILNVSVEHVGRLNLYINNTLNQTVEDPDGDYDFSLFSNTEQDFDVYFEFYYTNDTLYKTVDVGLVEFFQFETIIYTPAVSVAYISYSRVNTTMTTNLTCTNCGDVNVYVDGILNQTFVNATDESFDLTSSVYAEFNVTIEVFWSNGTFFQNISFIVYFCECFVYYIELPGFILLYQNNTQTSLSLDIVADNVDKVDVHVNNTLNSTLPGPAVYDTVTFTSLDRLELDVVISIYYQNGSLYRNVSIYLVILGEPEYTYVFNLEPRRGGFTGEIIGTSHYKLYVNGTRTNSLSRSFTPGDKFHVVFESKFDDIMYDDVIETGVQNLTEIIPLDMYWLTLRNNRVDPVQVIITRNEKSLTVDIGPSSTESILLFEETYDVRWLINYPGNPGAVSPVDGGEDFDMDDDRSIDFNEVALGLPIEIILILVGGITAGIVVIIGINQLVIKKPVPPGKRATKPSARKRPDKRSTPAKKPTRSTKKQPSLKPSPRRPRRY